MLLGLLFLDVLFFTVTGTVSNLRHREQLGAVVVPAALAAISLVGAVAAVASALARRRPAAGGTPAWIVVGAAVAGFVLALALPVATGIAEQQQRPEELPLRMSNTAYSSTSLTAKPGPVTVYVTNADLFWHTFTIDELGVEIKVPRDGHRRVTFTAASGKTYTYYCRVPGHAQAGMRGTVTVGP